MSRKESASRESIDKVTREALEKIRLHGSPWWQESWGTPAGLANDALNECDGAYAALEVTDER